MPRITFLAIVLAVAFANPLRAQGDAYVELYGDGVHKFYAGDLDSANELLTRVIESGSQDPRAYYFRGLVLEYQAPGSGAADFQAGAELEATGRLAVDVPTALTRIQGHLRTKIEVARRDARIRAEEERQRQRPRVESPAPSEPLRSPETDTLPPAETPPPAEEDAEMPPPSDEEAEENGAVEETDPFSDGGLRSEEATPDEEQPAAPDVTDIPNPFADDQPDDAPAPAPSAETPDEQTDPVDPFGGQEDGSGEDEPSDPFGEDPFEDF